MWLYIVEVSSLSTKALLERQSWISHILTYYNRLNSDKCFSQEVMRKMKEIQEEEDKIQKDKHINVSN
ncbi:hypothetical protein LXL04_007128 [Taraxacum kok-saghyz]